MRQLTGRADRSNTCSWNWESRDGTVLSVADGLRSARAINDRADGHRLEGNRTSPTLAAEVIAARSVLKGEAQPEHEARRLVRSSAQDEFDVALRDTYLSIAADAGSSWAASVLSRRE